MTGSNDEPGRCRECGWRGRYQRYGSWYCERHIGLAERDRDRDENASRQEGQ